MIAHLRQWFLRTFPPQRRTDDFRVEKVGGLPR